MPRCFDETTPGIDAICSRCEGRHDEDPILTAHELLDAALLRRADRQLRRDIFPNLEPGLEHEAGVEELQPELCIYCCVLAACRARRTSRYSPLFGMALSVQR